MPFPILKVSRDGVILQANKHSWIFLSFWRTEVGGRLPDAILALLDHKGRRSESDETELQVGFKVFALKFAPAGDGETDIYGFDITERKQAERKLSLNAQVFESAFEGIMITDAERRIVDVNQAFCEITGYARAEILGEDVNILHSGRHGAEFYEQLWSAVREKGNWQGEIWDRRKNGEIFPKWLSLSAVHDGEGRVVRYIGLFSDISVIKESEERLYRMANYDSLTGLFNRRYFQDQLERSLQQAKRIGGRLAVMFIDLDGFKLINDNLGHHIGDQALRVIAERLKECVRDTDTVARMGGDEFTVILPLLQDSEDAVTVAEKILLKVARPIELHGIVHFTSASIGIAVFPEDASNVDALIQNADTALYRAKERGKNLYQFYSPEMNLNVKARLSLKTRMRQALESNQLLIHYQPQVDVVTEKLAGLEALVRWTNGNGGFTDPESFIPIAEETGLINAIGEFVLRSVCVQGKIWLDKKLLCVPIAVNISSVQLHRPDVVKNIAAIIAETGFPPRFLEFELTETILIENVSEVRDKLRQIKELGCSLVIDDFGTEYSSLSYLKMFPIDKLKIDKSFILDLPENSSSSDIVGAIIAMGKGLKLKVVAEGVETAAQAEFLRRKGCTLFQGYYFKNPVPVAELGDFLERHDCASAIEAAGAVNA